MKRSSWEHAVSGVREYDDDAALDRVWNRLAARRHRPRRPGPVLQALAAVALLGIGVWLGMLVERSTDVDPMVRGEVILPAGRPSDADTARWVLGDQETTNEDSDGRHDPSPSPPRRSARLQSRTPSGEDPVATETDALERNAPALVAIPRASWLPLAERGDFAGALEKLDEAGGFDVALLSAGPDELMSLVDVARTMGRDDRAVQALRIVVEQYRADDNAPVAAMMLGNLLSRLGDAEGAAEAFALNRSLSPGGDFAEDALVREFEMAASASDVVAARRLRVQYEQDYPDGRHRDELRIEFEGLVAEVESTSGRIAWPADDAGEEAPKTDIRGDASHDASESKPREDSEGAAPAGSASHPSDAPAP